VARVIKQLQDLPGQELFRYVDDDGEARTIGSDDVNAYLREVTGDDFTAKDFRTWAGTVLAARALAAFDHVENERIAKKNITAAVERVAARLGNTRTVCRKCYIHPAVLAAYLDGELARTLHERAEEQLAKADLSDDEERVLRFLERRLAKAA
jgi:DNA topoisomerase-1